MVVGPVYNFKMIKKLKPLLTTGKTNKIYLLVLLIFLILIFEMIGIGFVPIFAVLITNPASLLEKIPPFLQLDILEKINEQNILLYGSIFLFLVFLIKNVFLGFLIYIEAKLMKTLRENTSKNLFSHYIYSNYLFYVNSNPATFIKTLNHDLGLSYRYIQSLLLMFREALLVLVVLILLLSVNIIVYSTTFLIFSLTTVIFYHFYKKSLVDKGRALQAEHTKNFKIINQSFSSIREIKISQKENFFKDHFFKNIMMIEKLYLYTYIVSRFPRLYLEVLAVLMISSFSFAMYFYDTDGQLIPLIALLAAACIRFIPAFTAITGSIHSLKLFSPSLDIILKEINSSKKIFSEKKEINKKNDLVEFNFNKSIDINNLDFTYPGSDTKALLDVNFSINKGDLICIVGESGSGKTTLINLILGFLSPQRGSITIDGNDINKNILGWYSKLGYVPQDVYLMDESMKSNIAFGVDSREIDQNLLEEVIKDAKLEKFINSLPDGLNTNAGHFGTKISGGQRQRIGIARALFSKPEILILDEATNALDIENESRVISNLIDNEKVKTIIFISHRNNNLDKFNKIYKVENKQVKKIK